MNWTEEINTAVDILLDGGVILYPTDTIWGLGSDILHQEAVEKIYSLKKESAGSPNFVSVINRYVKILCNQYPPPARKPAQCTWPAIDGHIRSGDGHTQLP